MEVLPEAALGEIYLLSLYNSRKEASVKRRLQNPFIAKLFAGFIIIIIHLLHWGRGMLANSILALGLVKLGNSFSIFPIHMSSEQNGVPQ